MEQSDAFEIYTPLTVGDIVPNFAFSAYVPEGKGEVQEMKMNDFKGKWTVLFFYPADFTFVCPTELEDMAKLHGEFQKEGAEILSVSTDTVFVHKAWHDTSPAIATITYPMVADPTHELSHAFGVYVANEGTARRGTFIINPEGMVIVAEINADHIGRNANETLRKVRAAKFVAEHKGAVCPANWNPGDDVLEPGLDLVGKI
tara:strand:- start:40054 stop:40659 length:606 start_codon:yes stop_codon:yes gene_type:complete